MKSRKSQSRDQVTDGIRPSGCIDPENLSAALDGEYTFTPEEREHLHSCARCRRLAEAYRKVDETVENALEQIPCSPAALERIRRGVKEKLNLPETEMKSPSIGFRNWMIHAAAAAVFCVLAGYFLFPGLSSDTEETIADTDSGTLPVSAAGMEENVGDWSPGLTPGAVELGHLRLAAAGTAPSFRFIQTDSRRTQKDKAAVIPARVRHLWLYNPAWTSLQAEQAVSRSLKQLAVPSRQIRLNRRADGALHLQLQLSRLQSVKLTGKLSAGRFQLISPEQPQPEQKFFYGTGREPVFYEAVLAPRGK